MRFAVVNARQLIRSTVHEPAMFRGLWKTNARAAKPRPRVTEKLSGVARNNPPRQRERTSGHARVMASHSPTQRHPCTVPRMWLHPMTRLMLRSIARAPAPQARVARAPLPPLLRVMAAQVDGRPARFTRHELHQLPPAKPARNRYAADDMLADKRNQEPRSPELEILPASEVVSLLRRCRYDRSRRLPIACIARAAGLHRWTLYEVMKTGQASEVTLAALTPILRDVAAGTVAFERRAGRWEQVEQSAG
jgi:hypothetical protein